MCEKEETELHSNEVKNEVEILASPINNIAPLI